MIKNSRLCYFIIFCICGVIESDGYLAIDHVVFEGGLLVGEETGRKVLRGCYRVWSGDFRVQLFFFPFKLTQDHNSQLRRSPRKFFSSFIKDV